MPKIAPMPSIPNHASPAPKKKDGADGAPSGSGMGFGELFREQTGAIPAKKPSGEVQVQLAPLASVTPEVSNAAGPPTADSLKSALSQTHPDVEIPGEVTTTKMRHVPAAEALIKPEGKADSALVAGCIQEDISGPSSMISEESGKVAEVASSQPARGSKEKNAGGGSDGKTEITAALPAPLQVETAIPILPASLPVLRNPGVAPTPAGGESQPFRQRSSAAGPQTAPRPIQLPAGAPRQPGVSSSAPPSADSSDVTGTASAGADFGFDRNGADEAEKVLVSSEDAGSKSPPEAASRVSHAVAERLAAQSGAPAAPLGTLVGQGPAEAPVAAVQHSGPVSPAGQTMTQATAGNSPSGAPNLYDRIDQGTSPVVLHSGAQHVSVGVHDPDLGWLEIQTQSTAGHVDATLITTSGQTHTSLATQLPAMAQYLEQRDVRMGSLLVHHHPMGSGVSGGGNGGPSYGSSNSGAGAHHSNAGDSGGGQAQHSSGAVTERLRPTPRVEALTSAGGEGAYGAVSYISVRA